MNQSRRRILQIAAGAAALPILSRHASALDYPTRPVRIVLGFPPGGISDIQGRLIAQWLSDRLGKSFFIDNHPGAAGNLGTQLVIRAQPDGYTLLYATAVNSWNTAIYNNLTFDFMRDLVPVASLSRAGGVMEVNLSFPAKSVPEFIAYAKANPAKINMATSGPGSPQHLWGELFKVMTGVDLLAVSYRGSALALPDLMSGRVDVMFDPVASSIDYIRAGKLRPLAVTTAARLDVLPDTPAIGEFVPGYEATGWGGLCAPVNTPPEIIAIINREVNAALADATFSKRLADLGSTPFASSPSEFGKFIVEYTDKWAKVIRAAGIKAE